MPSETGEKRRRKRGRKKSLNIFVKVEMVLSVSGIKREKKCRQRGFAAHLRSSSKERELPISEKTNGY